MSDENLKDIPFDEMIHVAKQDGREWTSVDNQVLNDAITSEWWGFCESSMTESEAIGKRMVDAGNIDFNSWFREPDYDADTRDSLADEAEAVSGKHARIRDKLFERVWETGMQPWKEVNASAGITKSTYDQLGDDYAEYYEERVQEYSNMMKQGVELPSKGRQVSSQLQGVYDEAESESFEYGDMEYV